MRERVGRDGGGGGGRKGSSSKVVSREARDQK